MAGSLHFVATFVMKAKFWTLNKVLSFFSVEQGYFYIYLKSITTEVADTIFASLLATIILASLLVSSLIITFRFTNIASLVQVDTNVRLLAATLFLSACRIGLPPAGFSTRVEVSLVVP